MKKPLDFTIKRLRKRSKNNKRDVNGKKKEKEQKIC